MRTIRFLFLAALAMAFGAGHAPAQEAIKVYTADLAPWTIPGNKAKPGFAYEVMSEMAKRSGLKVEIDTVPWRRGQQEIQDNPNTMGFHLFRTPDREAKYAWHFGILDSSVLFVSTGKPVNSVEQAKGLSRVVVLAGTPQETDMKNAGATNVNVVDKVDAAVRMLESGRVDAFFTVAERALFAWAEAGFPQDKLVLGKPQRTDKLFVASNKQMPAGSMEKLKAAFESMQADGTVAGIYKKYFGDKKAG
jgi:ABC-type amino acid transport substrate-binding protein